jgi:hypothetical protein
MFGPIFGGLQGDGRVERSKGTVFFFPPAARAYVVLLDDFVGPRRVLAIQLSFRTNYNHIITNVA